MLFFAVARNLLRLVVMRLSWRALAVLLAVGGSRCTCSPPCSNHTGPHATWNLQEGCAGYYCEEVCDPGWADCSDTNEGCTTSTTTDLPPNATLTSRQIESTGGGCSASGTNLGNVGTCSIVCNPGFFDCDHKIANGCETQSVDGCADGDAQVDAGEPLGAHRIAVISDPRGLVVCGGFEIFLDGTTLQSLDSVTRVLSDLTISPALPVDGLACDGSFVYWTTLSDSDAATPNSALYAVDLHGGTPSQLQNDFRAQSGVDVSDAGVLFMTSDGLMLSSDGGITPWMPATPTGAYNPFTVTSTDTWSIADASIYRRSSDAAMPRIEDAGAPSVIVNASGGPVAAIHVAFDDGGPTTDELVQLVDDAGNPSLASFGALEPIVASTSQSMTIVASDDTIYLVQPPNVTVLYTTSDHVADVAVDGSWVVWTTRGQGASQAGVWRGQIP